MKVAVGGSVIILNLLRSWALRVSQMFLERWRSWRTEMTPSERWRFQAHMLKMSCAAICLCPNALSISWLCFLLVGFLLSIPWLCFLLMGFLLSIPWHPDSSRALISRFKNYLIKNLWFVQLGDRSVGIGVSIWFLELTWKKARHGAACL